MASSLLEKRDRDRDRGRDRDRDRDGQTDRQKQKRTHRQSRQEARHKRRAVRQTDRQTVSHWILTVGQPHRVVSDVTSDGMSNRLFKESGAGLLPPKRFLAQETRLTLF